MVPPISFIHLMIFGLGPTEILVICFLILVLFGASKIPQLARGLGKGITEFKRGLKEEEREDGTRKEIEEETKQKDSNESP